MPIVMAVGRSVTPVERSLGHAGGAVGRSVTPVEQVWENWLKLTLAFCCGRDPIKNSGPISKEVAKRCEERTSIYHRSTVGLAEGEEVEG